MHLEKFERLYEDTEHFVKKYIGSALERNSQVQDNKKLSLTTERKNTRFRELPTYDFSVSNRAGC